MKVFQIVDGFCYWDATKQFPTVESTVGRFPPHLLFVEAPDYVFEGWGYLNGEFIQPEAPEGFLYDPHTGTFYSPKTGPSYTEREMDQQQITELELAVIELGQQITELELMGLEGM